MSDTPVLPFSLTDCEIARVCCHCRRSQTLSGDWRAEPESPDQFVTHVICPACFERHYPDLVAEVERFAVSEEECAYNEGDS